LSDALESLDPDEVEVGNGGCMRLEVSTIYVWQTRWAMLTTQIRFLRIWVYFSGSSLHQSSGENFA